MDRGDCQGSLHSSWSAVWPCDSAWGPSAFSFMGVQLSGGFTWHPVSGFLEVIWGLPELVPAWHGLYCWWHVNTGSSGGRTTCRGSRASSPTSIAYTICMQPLIAQIAPLSFQGSHRTQTQTSEVRWLHASVVTEWSPACLHKQFPGDLHRGN